MRLSFGRTRTKRGRTRGVAALEFALLLPFITILVLAMVDYGYYFYIGINATDAARTTAVQASATAAANGVNCTALNLTTVTGAAGVPAQAAITYMTTSVNAAIGLDTTATITCTTVSGAPLWGVVVTIDFPPASGSVHFGLPQSTTTPGHLRYRTPILYRR
jgi:Flp pilus assembly protein TadG